MGSHTDANLRAFAEKTGVEPATGQDRAKLEALSQAAYELIKIVELEKSGIRDGDGYWHGSDAVGGNVAAIVEIYGQMRAA